MVELMVVDYKATSVNKAGTLDDEWKVVYKRQMEIYQWLMRHNEDLKEYTISDTGYFVYVNGRTDKEALDGKLEFDVSILPYTGNDNWIEQTIINAHKCLMSNQLPSASLNCDFCQYREKAVKFEK